MTFLEQITPLILTYNEEVNIDRVLQKLTWAKDILILDSFSTDNTLDIVSHYPQCRVVQRTFDTFADQCNAGLELIQSEWVLSLDADYVLSDELLQDLRAIPDRPPVDSYTVPFKYCVFGYPLRGDNLTPRTVLYRRDQAHYVNDGHAHKVQIQGTGQTLASWIYHDDRKSLQRWLWSQDRYLTIEANKLRQTPRSQLDLRDKIRTLRFLAPLLVFIYCLFYKGVIFDGWQGWYYASQRMFVELLLSIKLLDTDLRTYK